MYVEGYRFLRKVDGLQLSVDSLQVKKCCVGYISCIGSIG